MEFSNFYTQKFFLIVTQTLFIVLSITFQSASPAVAARCTPSAKTKPILLRVPGSVARGSGNASWSHDAKFFPVTTDNRNLGFASRPYAITQTTGFGPLTVTNPPVGTYHTGAVACSSFVLDPLNFNAAAQQTVITGEIEWGQEPPSPSIFHGETGGFTFTSTQMIKSGIGGVASGSFVPFNIPLNVDDGKTGGSDIFLASDTDLLELTANDELIFRSTTTVYSTHNGFVDINSVGSLAGLLLFSGIEGSSFLNWLIEDISNGTRTSYAVSLEQGVFNATPNWASLPWEFVMEGDLIVSAFLPLVDNPTLDWESEPYSGDVSYTVLREGTGVVSKAITPNTIKDFGDAPDSYKTLLASDGPRYDDGFFQRLGFEWDAEPDGQPTIQADGDDVSLLGGFAIPVDDEDGVIFGDSFVDIIFNITRPGANDYQIRAWWDIDEDGCFDHLGVLGFDDMCPGNESELFINETFTFEPGIFVKRFDLGDLDPRKFYSRFRLTWEPLEDVPPFTEVFSAADCTPADAIAGNCISHGEVEDYPPKVPEPSTILSLLTLSGIALGASKKK